METIQIYTDGGCIGNPGPGAWAYIVILKDKKIKASGYEPDTTNNQMELKAVIQGIQVILNSDELKKETIEIFTDSQYVQKGMTQWIKNWEKNGWKTAAKKPVKNKELWVKLKAGADQLNVNWHWVMGHAGVPLNEECDQMVQAAIKSASL